MIFTRGGNVTSADPWMDSLEPIASSGQATAARHHEQALTRAEAMMSRHPRRNRNVSDLRWLDDALDTKASRFVIVRGKIRAVLQDYSEQEEIAAVPSELQHITEAIDRSREMLTWGDDWDGEGSPGYAQETWDRVVTFINKNALSMYRKLGIQVVAPVVQPGPLGSIDINWQNRSRRLLINVPVDAGAPISFYGDDRGQNSIEGSTDATAGNDWLLLWLMQ